MKVHSGLSLRALPLPAFVLHPLTAMGIAVLHVYLAAEHLLKRFGGEVTWTNIWKGFGALAGAYVFAALASRGRVKRKVQDQRIPELMHQSKSASERHCTRSGVLALNIVARCALHTVCVVIHSQ